MDWTPRIAVRGRPRGWHRPMAMGMGYPSALLAAGLPAITVLAPSTGPVGTACTITGLNFGASQGSNGVTVNGVGASVTSWSATSIGITIPVGATTGPVIVNVGGVPSNGLTFTVSGAVESFNYYVSTQSGAFDSNSGLSTAAPFRTLGKALSVLTAGQSVGVRGAPFTSGTYVENLMSAPYGGLVWPTGTSWSNKVRIANYAGETVSLVPSGGEFAMAITGLPQYLEFDGLLIDGDALNSNAIKVEAFNASNNPAFIRFINCEILGASSTADSPETRVPVLFAAPLGPTSLGGHQLLNCRVHRARNFYVGQGSLCVYVQPPNCIIDSCEMYDFRYGAMQLYADPSYGVKPNNTIVRNCIFRNPTVVSGSAHIGLVLYTADAGVQVYNNRIYGIHSDGSNTAGIEVAASNVKIYANTIYNTGNYGVNIVGGGANQVINNIIYQCPVPYNNGGSGTIEHHNSRTGINPVFAGPTDFHLTASTPLSIRDAGDPSLLATVGVDADGDPRGTPPDIGAYEYP